MAWLYILYSPKLNKFYVGQTVDLGTRIEYHNSGNVAFTSRGIPWELAHSEEYATRAEATRRERQIKAWKSAKAIRTLIEGSKG